MTKVKICGLRTAADVAQAAKSRADFVGFNFYAASPRRVSQSLAKELARQAAAGGVKTVGVFVNEAVDAVNAICDYANIDIIQLHGNEIPADCERLERPYWKALRVKNQIDLSQFSDYSSAEAFLFDNYQNDIYGGTGRAFDWRALQRVPSDVKVILAGGLSPANVQDALKFNPYAVDVNSGVESAPGVKDRELIKRFVELVRNYER